MATATYVLEIGADLDGVREMLLEVGAFATATEALSFGANAIGWSMETIRKRAQRQGLHSDYGVASYDLHKLAKVAGATICRYWVGDGEPGWMDDYTDDSWFIHIDSRRKGAERIAQAIHEEVSRRVAVEH